MAAVWNSLVGVQLDPTNHYAPWEKKKFCWKLQNVSFVFPATHRDLNLKKKMAVVWIYPNNIELNFVKSHHNFNDNWNHIRKKKINNCGKADVNNDAYRWRYLFRRLVDEIKKAFFHCLDDSDGISLTVSILRMPRCIAPGCTSGYDSNPEKLHFFCVPKDSEMVTQWHTALRRKNFVVKTRQAVCEKHFIRGDIIWFKEFKDLEGNVVARVSSSCTHMKISVSNITQQISSSSPSLCFSGALYPTPIAKRRGTGHFSLVRTAASPRRLATSFEAVGRDRKRSSDSIRWLRWIGRDQRRTFDSREWRKERWVEIVGPSDWWA